jgi:putative cardiolipin synthase
VTAHPDLSGFFALKDGENAFAARMLLVRDAETSLDVQYYIWHDDLTGKVFHNRLLQAADRGVRVRMLLDDLDTAGKDEMLQLIDAHPNIEIRLFNPFANRSARLLDFIGDARRINHRMHNKSLTADNQVTIFGGRNVGDEYFDAAEEVGFQDLDVLAVGPVVQDVSEAFDLYWNSRWAYPLSAFPRDDSVDDAQIEAFRQESDAFLEEAKSSEYAVALRALDIVSSQRISDLDLSWGGWVFVYDLPEKVEARELDRDMLLAPKLKKAIDRTREKLTIVSPYFVPGRKFTDYLVDMVENGVHVRILTNSLASNDVALVHAGYMRYRKDLIRGGVELYEFKPIKGVSEDTKKTEAKWSGSSRASLHGKFMSFDDEYVFVGSFNLDGRSVALNTELGVYFESPGYAEQIADAFDQRAMTSAYRVTLTDNDRLQWTTIENGEEVVFDVEPETGFWKRFRTGFMSAIVPEGQL